MSVLAQKNILIGVSGGIAAYKIPLLIRQLVKLKSNVKVVMTPSSKEFVTPLTLSTVSTFGLIMMPHTQHLMLSHQLYQMQ